MVSAVVAFPLALDHLGLAAGEPAASSAWRAGRCCSSILLVGARRALPVRTEPARGAVGMAECRHAGGGSCSGSPVPAALSWYLSNFGNYNATYGSLGAAIGLMMWMWMSAIIVLCGAELNSEIEHQTARDTTVGPPKPLGARGAVDGRHGRTGGSG